MHLRETLDYTNDDMINTKPSNILDQKISANICTIELF